jgi:hypothetical protein
VNTSGEIFYDVTLAPETQQRANVIKSNESSDRERLPLLQKEIATDTERRNTKARDAYMRAAGEIAAAPKEVVTALAKK